MQKLVSIFFSLIVAFSSVISAENTYFPSDDSELKEYLSRMPWQYYKQYTVQGLGTFWVDEGNVDCVKDEIKKGHIWEPYVIDNLSKYIKKGDFVIDIGAHIGTITMAMSNLVGDGGFVYAFEGERQLFRELVENIKLNQKKNVYPLLCWVSDTDKVLEATWYWGPSYSPVHSNEDKPYQLHVRRLDSFGFNNISVIKIDVDGSDNCVLFGAYETIMKCRPVIVMEIMGGFGWEPTPEIQEKINYTISILTGMGYNVTKIFIDDYLAVPSEKQF